MFIYRVNINKQPITAFGELRVGQSFTTDNLVYMKVKPFSADGRTYNAVRISAEKKPKTSRFRYFETTVSVGNPRKYHLVHESRLEEAGLI